MRFLCGLAQNSGPLGNRSLRETSLFVAAARHAGIEVDLLVSRNYTVVHECAGFSDGENRCFLSPGVGTKVIPAEQDLLGWQSGVTCSGPDELCELLGCQASVATELVDLA